MVGSDRSFAQEGPIIPCVGCENFSHFPWPETGAWYNPDQSGSGLNLEIQNGYLLGFHYGYDADGRPEWRLISGQLVASETPGVQWELKTKLQRYEGGNCMGCPYQPPTKADGGDAIRLEFLQRNYLRVTFGNSPGQYFVPILYGQNGYQYFGEDSPYVFPELGGYFALVFKPGEDPPDPKHWRSVHVHIPPAYFSKNHNRVTYALFSIESPADVYPYGVIECELDEVADAPTCKLDLSYPNETVYSIPVANISDTRFFGEAPDGSTVEAFRIAYD